jgi:hypothetical protein
MRAINRGDNDGGSEEEADARGARRKASGPEVYTFSLGAEELRRARTASTSFKADICEVGDAGGMCVVAVAEHSDID